MDYELKNKLVKIISKNILTPVIYMIENDNLLDFICFCDRNIKMQEIYKKNQVNPMAGCLPLFVQMCIFITLFRVLNDANSIPNDATFLWFNLKQPDALVKLPFTGMFSAINIFPLLNTVVTFFQQKMMSTGTQDSNPQMKTMLYTLPLVILVMTYNMPSGVSLYWFTSSLLAVIQQFFIMKGRN